jgi:hypothetical protein
MCAGRLLAAQATVLSQLDLREAAAAMLQAPSLLAPSLVLANSRTGGAAGALGPRGARARGRPRETRARRRTVITWSRVGISALL